MMNRLALILAVASVVLLFGCGGDGNGLVGSLGQERDGQQQSAPAAKESDNESSGGSLKVGGEATIAPVPGSCPRPHVTPSLYSPTVGCVASGTRVTIVGGPASSEGSEWWEIRSDGTRGWLQSRILSPSQ